MSGRKRLLLVGFDDALREQLGPALGRGEFEVDAVARYASAGELVGAAEFGAVLVNCPAPDGELVELLAALRRSEAASRKAQLLLLAAPACFDVATRYAVDGSGHAVSTGVGGLAMQEAVLGLLRARPRLAARVMARLTVRIEEGAARRLCQTRDLSRTGMLAILDDRYPIGSPVAFVLELPDEHEGVQGEAEVVRHAARPRDPVDGLGLRFVTFRAGDAERLVRFLARHGA